MIKQRNSLNKKCLKVCALFLFPFTLFGGIALSRTAPTTSASESYKDYHSESISLTNADFTQGGTPYVKGNNLSGWNAIETDSKAQGMIIDVGNSTQSGEENSTFTEHRYDYMLNSNPHARGDDNRILMINSKEKFSQERINAFKGYRSSTVTLEANSYYKISLSALTMLNGDDYANASIYISGLKDKDGKDFKIGYEFLDNKVWKDYFLFLATGEESQTVTIDLYLGTKDGDRSQGVVFFDNVSIERYSENAFFKECEFKNYNGVDNCDRFDNETVFMVDKLAPKSYIVEGTDLYNFDFEDETEKNSDTLGDHWKIITKSNANARIIDVRDTQAGDFYEMTKHAYFGDDLSKDNTQGLVLWTGSSNEYTNGYVGVKSENIDIKAHNIYRVTLKLKLDNVKEGSFYLKVSENETIYTLYPSIISDDSEAKNYYTLQNGKTSGITTNTSNAWTNDYQTVEFYIKGHSLYNSSVNLELWLGDNSTQANGCAIVDNVKVEYATNSQLAGATNKLELSKQSSTTLTNSYFNDVASDFAEREYPFVANGWTIVKQDDKKNTSGIIYIGSDEQYNDLYRGKYDWAGINPLRGNENPENIYMMFNRANSYQSITSSTTTLESDSYYKLSFDFYNQDYSSLNKSAISVEVVDDNGILLFSQSGFRSIDAWKTLDIYFHTAKTVSHTVSVIVRLGDEDKNVGGTVYLDNFDIIKSDEAHFASADYKSDLTNYYLNLYSEGNTNKITTSPAYDLQIDDVFDPSYTSATCGAEVGIVSGKDNIFDVYNDNNILVISNKVASSASLVSKYKLTVDSDKYYKLTFDLKTIFGEEASLENKGDKDHKCGYGVKVTVDGYDAISGLISNDELKSYSIYLNASENSSTPTIKFTLVSDCNETIGTALITNIDFTSVNEDEYNLASSSKNENSFTTKPTSQTEDTKPEEPTTPDTSTNGMDNRWLLASSIIMGLALIIAIVGFMLRRVKIKKIERVKKESYDRKLSVNHDAVLVEAQKRRDKEVTTLQQAKVKLSEDRVRLEEEHKEFVKSHRQASNGKLSREVEVAFKKYNSNIAKIDEKINIIKEKIDFCMTADYLLSIERKILAEEDEKRSKEKKAIKAQLKNRQ